MYSTNLIRLPITTMFTISKRAFSSSPLRRAANLDLTPKHKVGAFRGGYVFLLLFLVVVVDS